MSETLAGRERTITRTTFRRTRAYVWRKAIAAGKFILAGTLLGVIYFWPLQWAISKLLMLLDNLFDKAPWLRHWVGGLSLALRALPDSIPNFRSVIMEIVGCGGDGELCIPAKIRNSLDQIGSVTSAATNMDILVAVATFSFIAWAIYAVFIRSAQFEGEIDRGPKISKLLSTAFLFGALGTFTLASWAGEQATVGPGEARAQIPYEMGIVTLILFSIVVVFAGAIATIRRNSWRLGDIPIRVMQTVTNGATLVGSVISRIVNGVDYVLVVYIARAAGASVTYSWLRQFVIEELDLEGESLGARTTSPPPSALDAFLRYATMLLWFSLLALLIVLASAPLCWWASFAAAASAFAIIRRWSWIEEDRRYWMEESDVQSKRANLRIGFEQDLTDEAMTVLAIVLLVVMPVILMRASHESLGFRCTTLATSDVLPAETNSSSSRESCPEPSPITTGNEVYSPSWLVANLVLHTASAIRGALPSAYVDWLAFIGGEFTKALPFLDWSEVYQIRNGAKFEPSSRAAMDAVFVVRASMDVLLLATFVQALSSLMNLGRLRGRFADPGDSLDILDPFEARAVFAAAGSSERRAQEVAPYNQTSLLFAIENEHARACNGAAWIAGWQLADVVIAELLKRRYEIGNEKCAKAAAGLRARVSRLGEQALRALMPLIVDLESEPTDENVELVDAALRRLRERRELLELAGRVNSRNSAVSARAEIELVRRAASPSPETTPSIVELLGEHLSDPSANVRRAITRALGATSDIRAIRFIAKALRDPSFFVVILAIRASIRIAREAPGDAKRLVVKLLCDVLRAGDYLVRSRIADALGSLGDSYAVEHLAELAEPMWPPFDRDYHASVVAALGLIGNRRAVRKIVQVARWRRGEIRREAFRALTRLADPAAVRIANGRPIIPYAAIEVLAASETPRAEKILIAIAGAPSPFGIGRLRRAAALAELDFSSSAPAAGVRLSVLGDTSAAERLRSEAFWSLINSGVQVDRRSIVECVQRVADTPYYDLRLLAAWSIAKMRLTELGPHLRERANTEVNEDLRAINQIAEQILATEHRSSHLEGNDEALDRLLRSRYYADRAFGTWALARFCESQRLIEMMVRGGESRLVRETALKGFSFLASQRIIGATEIAALRSMPGRLPEHRYASAMMVDAVGSAVGFADSATRSVAIALLRSALDSGAFRGRIAAAFALARIGGESEVPVLQRRLNGHHLVGQGTFRPHPFGPRFNRPEVQLRLEEDIRVREALRLLLEGLSHAPLEGDQLSTTLEWARSRLPWQRQIAGWVLGEKQWNADPAVWSQLQGDMHEQVRDVTRLAMLRRDGLTKDDIARPAVVTRASGRRNRATSN